ncbi:MAG TPA: hypothetical protein VI756_01120 [Blastocatellia bacterium]
MKLVRPGPNQVKPPANLKGPGRELWQTILQEFVFTDGGSLAILAEACTAKDRAEECAMIIAKDGLTIRTKTGTRDHPLLRAELLSRSFLTRTLGKLGVVDIPAAAKPGRPVNGGLGVTDEYRRLAEE